MKEFLIDPAKHPALTGFREVIQLSGYSGAVVALVRRPNGKQFVRKAASEPSANAMLREQAKRQVALIRVVQGCAALPDIIEENEARGLYYFDMPFIPSRDAVNFLSNCSFESTADFASRIERVLEALAQSQAIGESAIRPEMNVLTKKVDQILVRTEGRYQAALAPLLEAANSVDTLIPDTRPTATHGDLTFENILVGRRGDLWLIDAIQSPFDHYWIDWSKLFQECEGRWHAHRGRPIASGVTRWLRNRFMAAASRLTPTYPTRHYILLGLTFARILPYVQSEDDRVFVTRRVVDCGNAALRALDQG